MFSTLKQTIVGTFAHNEYETELLKHDGDSNLIKAHSRTLQVDFKGSPINVRAAIVPHQNARIMGDVLDDLPIVLYIHGLGGQLNQFEYVIDSCSFVAHSVAIDLPGHGKSEFIDDWDLYTTTSFVDICQQVLQDELIPKHKGVFIVGHSMGCIVSVRLAKVLGDECIGIAAITPPYESAETSEKLAAKKKWLYYVPPLVFDVFRAAVRIGGTDSKSVKSMMSTSSKDESILSRQLRVNLQSQTKTWLRTAYGIELLSETTLRAVTAPTIVIGAEDDKVCPNAKLFADHVPQSEYHLVHGAGHAILIEKPHVLSGLFGEFGSKCNSKLSQTWQLEYIASKSDKWSLKNEKKWRETQSVGSVVAGFRGMKTLRQGDNDHSPTVLEQNYPDIVAVVDISREKPSYDPATFTRIKYHKFPTIAKHPPSIEEVRKFIKLVDGIKSETSTGSDSVIAVHCHYGFNRTGFLICSYLIERESYSVEDALTAYDKSRATGVHHAHFIDELHLRYNQ